MKPRIDFLDDPVERRNVTLFRAAAATLLAAVLFAGALILPGNVRPAEHVARQPPPSPWKHDVGPAATAGFDAAVIVAAAPSTPVA